MDIRPTDEQDALAAMVRRFLLDQAPLAGQREPGDATTVWKGMAELGVAGVLVPDSAGGSGLGPVEVVLVAEQLGAVAAGVPFVSSAVESVATLQAVDADTASLQAEIAAGRPTVVLDARHHETGAGLSGGPALFPDVLDATGAQTFLVLTSSGLSRVDRHDDTVDVQAAATVDATRPVARVQVSGGARDLGRVDPARLARAQDLRALALVADGVGAAQAALDYAGEYAKTRVQFGRPIGSFQSVQHLCVDMYAAVELARLGARAAAWALGSQVPRARYSVAASAVAGADLSRVSATAVQVLGGVGYTWEHDVQLLHKRLLSLRALLRRDPLRHDTLLAAPSQR